MLKDTDRVRPAALRFLESGGYTTALPGTRDYYEFWDEEKKRCMYGYEVDELTCYRISLFLFKLLSY